MAKVARPAPIERKCPYCKVKQLIHTPYDGDVDRSVLIPCANERCRRRMKVSIVAGAPTGVLTPRRFKYSSRLRLAPDGLKGAADLTDEACESSYLGSPRAGAVALRAAAEVFVFQRLSNLSPRADVPTLKGAIEQLRRYSRFNSLPSHGQHLAKAHLEAISAMGDSAAHDRLRDESRRVQLIPSELDDRVGMFEKVLEYVYGWR